MLAKLIVKSATRDDTIAALKEALGNSRINDLDSVDDVYDVLFKATYMMLGLGDVYFGAPVATQVDPRHRLVTTKHNPAHTWTPENAVGIGGAYLCAYGMEGPGRAAISSSGARCRCGIATARLPAFAMASRGCCACSIKSNSTK